MTTRITFLVLLFHLMGGITTGVHGQGRPSEDAPISLPIVVKTAYPFSRVPLPEIAVPKIGLVLSGGVARGISQIGVLKALEEENIPLDFIVGVSVGSIIGGLYATGLTADDLRRSLRTMNWNAVLMVSNEAPRRELFVDQKRVVDRSILTLRFDGLNLVIPPSVSNGQRLTNMLQLLALQGIYRPLPDFDALKYRFRAIATDLYSGKRYIFRDGNLGTAMRASSTVPVLYAPLVLDSMALVDGGLVSNVPTDVALAEGCDIVIAVNTTSGLRKSSDITNPLETFDQVLNVMMEIGNREQLKRADVVIEPDVHEFSSTAFEYADTLIQRGYDAAKKAIPRIKKLIASWYKRQNGYRQVSTDDTSAVIDAHESIGSTPPALFQRSIVDGKPGTDAASDWDAGAGRGPLVARTIFNVIVHRSFLPAGDSLPVVLQRLLPLPYTNSSVRTICETILRQYRSGGYSLASVDSTWFEDDGEIMHVMVSPGRLGAIRVRGNKVTNEVVILREFPLRPGQIFHFQEVKKGLARIEGLGLFNYVGIDIQKRDSVYDLILNVIERSARMVRLGIRADNERNAQIAADLRDDNIFGTGASLSFGFFGGKRNRRYEFNFRSNRLFWTNVLVNAQVYYDLADWDRYRPVPTGSTATFKREPSGLYRTIIAGASFSLGTTLERFGNVTASLVYEDHSLRYVSGELESDEKNRIGALELRSLIDSKDRYPFPRSGMHLNVTYRSAQRALGSTIAFFKVSADYGAYFSLGPHTIHPRIQFGYADKTLPFTEQFALGGENSFWGMREYELRGRQLFATSLEYRYQLPIRILFDTYLRFRYDLGSIWTVPEAIRFKDLHHGIGVALAFDTPIGPSQFGIGKSFLIKSPSSPHFIVTGPTMLYYSIGIGL
ncbi:MAG: BamA/TamA family outer membrane protein [Chlorobi bacterium]|nr:BamA/TamA family outer membrane protein [Chlorobiota bacterium]